MNPPIDLIDRIFTEDDEAPETHDSDPLEDPLDDEAAQEAVIEPDTLTDIEVASIVDSTLTANKEADKEAALVPAQPAELTEDEKKRREVDEARHSDAELARQNLKTMIKHGETLLNSLVLNCGASDDPKFFQAAAQMLKEVSSMNKDLLRLHRAEQELKDMNKPGGAAADAPAPVQIDKAVIVSTPSELLAAVKNKKK